MIKKLYILELLRVLQEQSDEEHILTQNDIQKSLLEEYKHTMCRQAFRSNIQALIDVGFKISTYLDNRKGYYLQTRSLSEQEVMYFCHSMQHDPSITEEQEKGMRKSVLNILSKPMSEEVLSTLTMKYKKRKQNTGTLGNLEVLARAIKTEKKISFDYYHHDIKKQLIRNQHSFEDVEPRFIVKKDGRNYLITSGGRHDTISHYRIDKMRNIQISDAPVAHDFKYLEACDYALTHVYMFAGTPRLVKLRCSKSIPNIYDKMIDEFGEEVEFEDIDDEWFGITTRSTPEGILFLAQKYMDALYIVYPKELKEEMTRRIDRASERYSNK